VRRIPCTNPARIAQFRKVLAANTDGYRSHTDGFELEVNGKLE
jgi:hypothetical protein